MQVFIHAATRYLNLMPKIKFFALLNSIWTVLPRREECFGLRSWKNKDAYGETSCIAWNQPKDGAIYKALYKVTFSASESA